MLRVQPKKKSCNGPPLRICLAPRWKNLLDAPKTNIFFFDLSIRSCLTVFFSLIANFICKTGDSSISTSITTTNITTTGSTSIVTRPYPSKPTGNCDLEDVLCSDGTCVPLSRQCDRVRDCPDGADEIACGNFFFFFAFTLPLFHFFSFF